MVNEIITIHHHPNSMLESLMIIIERDILQSDCFHSQPLSLDVWIYMTTAYLGVSITMFLLARFNLNHLAP